MPLLPEGFALPPLPHLVALVVALGGVAFGFSRRAPPVTPRHVVGLAPWMVVGSSLHVLYVLDALPAVVRPLGGTPAVYLAVAAAAGAIWLAADVRVSADRVPLVLAVTGCALIVPAVAAALYEGARAGTLSPWWPAAALVLSVLVSAVSWIALTRTMPRAAVTGGVGALAVFGHVLDGVSTAVGVDVLRFGERTPLSRTIMDLAAGLPTAEALGVGWLFVLVKLAVVFAVVLLFTDYVTEKPTEGYLLLGFVAAVGLGPGAHNLLLFTVAG